MKRLRHRQYCSMRTIGLVVGPFTTVYSTRGGGNLPWFWVRTCDWSPRTPPHSYTRLGEKYNPFMYLLLRKWYIFIYYFSYITYSYTFWVKMIPHWNTFEVKSIPIHILGSLKSTPHSSRTPVYTFIMEVNPDHPVVYRSLLKRCTLT